MRCSSAPSQMPSSSAACSAITRPRCHRLGNCRARHYPAGDTCAEIVQDYDVAGTQGRYQDLANVRLEDFGVGGAVNGHAGSRAVEPDRGDHRGGLPMAVGTARHQPLPTRSPPAQAGQVGLGRRFVDKDEPIGGELTLPGASLLPRDRDKEDEFVLSRTATRVPYC